MRWCHENGLKLNVRKCKKVGFTRNRRCTDYYYIIGAQVSHLGVLVDKGLRFVPHIINVGDKAMRLLGFLIRNTRDFTNISCMKLLFY